MSAYEQDIRPPHDPDTCTREGCGRCRIQSKTKAPTIGVNPHDADAPPAPPDATVHSIGLPKHPDPFTIAAAFEEAAKAIRSRGLKAIDMASVLAAKGYSATTLGDGGARGTDGTSTTERLAMLSDRWTAADEAYAHTLRMAWLTAMHTAAQTNELLRHASDDDHTPAGQGECRACARFVKTDPNRKSHRLRSGLCPSCFNLWCSYQSKGGPMLWSEWTSKRREGLTERNDSGQVVRIHTPEPEPEAEG